MTGAWSLKRVRYRAFMDSACIPPTDYADNVVEHAVASPASADTESPASVGTSLCRH